MLNKLRPSKEFQSVARWTLFVIGVLAAFPAFLFLMTNFPNVILGLVAGVIVIGAVLLVWGAIVPPQRG
jgi:hypothetical protein